VTDEILHISPPLYDPLKRPLVVNLFAGPGAGKSTTAAKIFAALKDRGINVELAGEYAKDLTWEGRHRTLADQFYVFGKQHHRIYRLVTDCDVIVTDSPILMGLAYADGYPQEFKQTVRWAFNRYRNLNFLLKRTKPYNPKGRNQTLEEAKQKDVEILRLLSWTKEPFKRVSDDQIDEIVAQVVTAA
jgi:adenylate kinase family enzyme